MNMTKTRARYLAYFPAISLEKQKSVADATLTRAVLI